MNIYYALRGAHIHMRLFMNKAKIGDLCVRESEWEQFKSCFWPTEVNFIEDSE